MLRQGVIDGAPVLQRKELHNTHALRFAYVGPKGVGCLCVLLIFVCFCCLFVFQSQPLHFSTTLEIGMCLTFGVLTGLFLRMVPVLTWKVHTTLNTV